MGKIEKIANHWSEPGWWWCRAIPYLLRRPLRLFYYDPYYSLRYGGRCDIMDEDWDNLIILDACRYDTFADRQHLDGRLDHRISRGAVSGEFLRENFNGTYHDTVYVTANPWVSYFAGDRYEFHKIVSVWKDRWDEELKTVHPAEVVEATVEAQARHPEKRVIAHFMQPHQPFIGERAQDELGSLSGNLDIRHIVEDEARGTDLDREGEFTHVWYLLKNGEIDRDTLREYYNENLDLVLEHTENLLEVLEERTVITSDHGQMFGEYATPFPFRVYGHTDKFHTEKLVKVPWFVVEGENRKEIRSEPPVEQTSPSEISGEVERKLEHLGYLGE